MFALFIGLSAGGFEFYLLSKITRAVTAGQKIPFLIIWLKILVLTTCLLGCGFLFPSDLLWAGIGIALPLIAGAFWQFIRAMRMQKETENPAIDGPKF